MKNTIYQCSCCLKRVEPREIVGYFLVFILFCFYARKHKHRDMHRHIPLLKPLFVHTLFRLPSLSLHFSRVKLRSPASTLAVAVTTLLMRFYVLSFKYYYYGSIFLSFFFLSLYYNDFKCYRNSMTRHARVRGSRSRQLHKNSSFASFILLFDLSPDFNCQLMASVTRVRKGKVSKQTRVRAKMFLFP